MEVLNTYWAWFAAAFCLVGVAGYALRRWRRERHGLADLETAVARRVHEPASLHPVIDPDICIGSLSCITACPEGDILGIVDGSARLIRGANCIGHGRCATECPVGAIRLVFGTSERGIDLPEVDEDFETSRPGVHVVGELGGMGLIRNALTQGVQVASALGRRLGAGERASDRVDVLVVGAGPSGLATALGCRAAGLSFRIVDQETAGGTVAHYPRHKIVMTDTVELPIFGRFGRKLISKEDLLVEFAKMRESGGFSVEEGTRVLGLEGSDGAFTVQTSKGPIGARKVVLAVGRRGTPRKLGVPGEELDKIAYRLIETDQYVGAALLVVGGGDSALEAAIQIAGETDATVALSHRGEELGRCRDANRQKYNELVASGRIRGLPNSAVKSISRTQVVLDVKGAEVTLDNDAVLVCIGGELPLEFLQKAGVTIKRLFGTELQKPVKLKAGARADTLEQRQERRHQRLVWALFAVGVAIVAALAWVGGDYYLLTTRERLHAPDHAWLKPAGNWGHGVGVVATLFMLANFLYAVRKRWRLLKGSAPIRSWLTFHMFVGFMSPLVIAFHAAFQSRNGLATATGVSLFIVVATGVVGRFIYGLVPTRGGVELQLAEVLAQVERSERDAAELGAAAKDSAAIKLLVARANTSGGNSLLLLTLLRIPFDGLRLRLGLFGARGLFEDAETRHAFEVDVLHLAKLRNQVAFFGAFKRVLRGWRLFHGALAGLLVVMIAAHIAVSLYLGYAWIFR